MIMVYLSVCLDLRFFSSEFYKFQLIESVHVLLDKLLTVMTIFMRKWITTIKSRQLILVQCGLDQDYIQTWLSSMGPYTSVSQPVNQREK